MKPDLSILAFLTKINGIYTFLFPLNIENIKVLFCGR